MREENLTDLDTSNQSLTTNKMKLPLFVFSLVVLYWACIICTEENVNSMIDVIHSVENLPEHQDVFWERALSRNKRSVLISPVSNLLLQGLKKSISLILKLVLKLFEPMLDLGGFIFGELIGINTCPKVENLSILLIIKSIIIHPIKTIETVVCYIFDLIGSELRTAIRKLLEKAIVFTNKVLLPGLHETLNAMKDNLSLPPSIVAMIDIFDIFYAILKILKIVG